jgi:hypothetical protein
MSAGGTARYRRYNVPAVCDYEAMKKGVRTCLACGATDVATGRVGFAGRVCAKCLPGQKRIVERPAWNS